MFLTIIKKRLLGTDIVQFARSIFMSDDKKNIDNPDRQKINMSEEYQFRDWKKYGVSFDQLKRVVKDAGSIAKDVEEFLKKRHKKQYKLHP